MRRVEGHTLSGNAGTTLGFVEGESASLSLSILAKPSGHLFAPNYTYLDMKSQFHRLTYMINSLEELGFPP